MSGAMLGMYEDKKDTLLALGHVEPCDMADRNRETGLVEALIRFLVVGGSAPY